MPTKNSVVLLLLFILVTLSSCSAIAGIFKAGMSVGIFIVLVIIVLIAILILKLRR